MKKIERCRVCGFKGLVNFFDMGEQPPANSLIPNKDVFVESYPLSLSWCPNCRLVQLNETLDPKMLFSNYVWVTGTSQSTIAYSNEFFKWIDDKMKDKRTSTSFIVEIASNDGTFLKPFIEHNYRVLGVEPAKNISDMANDNGILTLNDFFNTDTAKKIVNMYGEADVVIARNVIPHVANLHSVIEGCYNSLKDDGLLVIECHNASVINDKMHYDSIYHEHLHYFTINTIEYLLNMHNLYINDVKDSKVSGGSMVLFINKFIDENESVKERRRQDRMYDSLVSWEYFANRAYEHRNFLLKTIDGKRMHCFGASARGLSMLNFCRLGNKTIVSICDNNPIKQNMFTPVTHIPILSVEEMMKDKPDCILITAWNFADEIMTELKVKYGYDGKFIIPLPILKKV